MTRAHLTALFAQIQLHVVFANPDIISIINHVSLVALQEHMETIVPQLAQAVMPNAVSAIFRAPTALHAPFQGQISLISTIWFVALTAQMEPTPQQIQTFAIPVIPNASYVIRLALTAHHVLSQETILPIYTIYLAFLHVQQVLTPHQIQMFALLVMQNV